MIFSADTESNETGETNLWRPLSESISDGRPSKPECIETPKVESNFANANGNGISPQSKAVLPPFSMKAGISAGEVIDTLTEGKAVLHALTIPEGLTSEQIAARLNENEILTGDIETVP